MNSEPKSKGGRPPKSEDQRLVQRSIRMRPTQWAKFDAAGGVDWLRGLVDKARPKVPPEKG